MGAQKRKQIPEKKGGQTKTKQTYPSIQIFPGHLHTENFGLEVPRVRNHMGRGQHLREPREPIGLLLRACRFFLGYHQRKDAFLLVSLYKAWKGVFVEGVPLFSGRQPQIRVFLFSFLLKATNRRQHQTRTRPVGEGFRLGVILKGHQKGNNFGETNKKTHPTSRPEKERVF